MLCVTMPLKRLMNICCRQGSKKLRLDSTGKQTKAITGRGNRGTIEPAPPPPIHPPKCYQIDGNLGLRSLLKSRSVIGSGLDILGKVPQTLLAKTSVKVRQRS